MPNTKYNLFEIQFEKDGIFIRGSLFIGESGKLEFEGDAEESARVFFEEYLKPICEKYIDLLIDKKDNPLFYWKEGII